MLDRRRFFEFASLALGATIVAATLSLPQAVAQTAAQSPEAEKLLQDGEAYIQALADEAFAMSNDDGSTDIEGMRELIRESVDMRYVAGFSLGKYSRLIPPDQKEEYLEIFPEFAIKRYATLMARFAGLRLAVYDSRANSTRNVVVYSRVLGDPQYDGSVVAWHLRVQPDKSLKIIDVGFEGNWIVVMQREEFTSVVDNNGGPNNGGFDVLLALLRNEVEEESGDKQNVAQR